MRYIRTSYYYTTDPVVVEFLKNEGLSLRHIIDAIGWMGVLCKCTISV